VTAAGRIKQVRHWGIMADDAVRSRRSGRPRVRPGAPSDLSPREQIMDAAAALFVESGFAATTTRLIAEQVGIRQASLYYHFGGKDEILLELLTRSVRPSLEAAHRLAARAEMVDDPAAGLYALVLVDVGTLSSTSHNVGTLYLLPEVQQPQYDAFRAERTALQAVYGRLAAAAGHDDEIGEELAGALVMQLVESVIQIRRDGLTHPRTADVIARSCLRVVGLAADEVDRARLAALALLTEPDGGAGPAT
jgi:AcrR family transcriptional regulator